MEIKAEVRYLKDKDGETFIPMAHADYVIGLPDDLSQRLNYLENSNYYLSNKVIELEQEIESIKGGY